MRFIVGATALAFACTPAAAQAKVSISAATSGGTFVITADDTDNATQDLTVTQTGTTLTFASNNLEQMTTPTTGCIGVGPVICTIPGGNWANVRVNVNLNGGNDKLTASALTANDPHLQIDGGDGDDQITGSSFNDQLAGGNGVDLLNGGPGNDTLILKGDGGADNPASTCGSGTQDFVLADLADRSTAIKNSCEQLSPLLGPVSIQGNPVVGSSLTLGYSIDSVGSLSPTSQSQWFTCATIDEQGCSLSVPGATYTSSAADAGRYLFGVVSAGLAAFPSLNPMDSGTSAPVLIAPASAPGSGAAVAIDTPIDTPAASPVFSLGRSKASGTGSTVTLTVDVPGPGTVSVGPIASATVASTKGKKVKALVATSSKSASRAGPVTVPVRLTKEGTKQLKKKGKLQVRVEVTYIPIRGSAGSKTTTLEFKATKKHKAKKKESAKKKKSGEKKESGKKTPTRKTQRA